MSSNGVGVVTKPRTKLELIIVFPNLHFDHWLYLGLEAEIELRPRVGQSDTTGASALRTRDPENDLIGITKPDLVSNIDGASTETRRSYVYTEAAICDVEIQNQIDASGNEPGICCRSANSNVRQFSEKDVQATLPPTWQLA